MYVSDLGVITEIHRSVFSEADRCLSGVSVCQWSRCYHRDTSVCVLRSWHVSVGCKCVFQCRFYRGCCAVKTRKICKQPTVWLRTLSDRF